MQVDDEFISQIADDLDVCATRDEIHYAVVNTLPKGTSDVEGVTDQVSKLLAQRWLRWEYPHG